MFSKIFVGHMIFFGIQWHRIVYRGILLGVDLNVFDIRVIDEGNFYVKFALRIKPNDFKFVLYSVYGPAQSQNKSAFLVELTNTCSKETLPYMIAGDFNIMRTPQDKSSGDFDPKWPNIFNVFIKSLDLKEIRMLGCLFTLVGLGDNLTFEKLDRVLVTTEFETLFPLTTLEPSDRNISDHTPLVLNTGASTH